MAEIGIVDTRNIIKLIQEKYACDFSDYALTSFKRRLENILLVRNLKHPEMLINRIKEDRNFYDQFLDDIAVPSSEMFRDPSLWRLLRDETIPKLYQETPNFKIWLPGVVSGDELFSLCIILKELNLLGKIHVHVSSLSNFSLDTIKKGYLKASKVEVSEENYVRANGKENFTKYYKEVGGNFLRDTSLLDNVTFELQNIEMDNAPSGVRLIIYRNKMVYFNPTLQLKILKVFYSSLQANGYLIIGVKEFLGNLYNVNDFTLANPSESIYKKK